MSPLNPNNRLLPGSTEPPLRPIEPVEPSGTVSFRQVYTVLRRRYQLILAMTLCGATLGLFLASREPATYRAGAMLRFAGERRELTGDQDQAPGLKGSADPLLSIIELLRSRTVAGVVVDTLGLQLTSWTPGFATADLAQVHVDPRAAGDSVQLVFRPNEVVARRADREVTSPYGQVMNLGVVQFAVRARPPIETATLGIARQGAGDRRAAGRPPDRPADRDRRDRRRLHRERTRSPPSASSTPPCRRSSRSTSSGPASAPAAGASSSAEQLAQTDSMLARAQGELSTFRSRQQLASSHDKLEAEQSAALTLETRMAELDADRQTFGALQQQLKAGDEAGRTEALRALATSPAMADNPVGRPTLPAAPGLPGPPRFDDHGPLAERRPPTPT